VLKKTFSNEKTLNITFQLVGESI